MIHHIQRSHQRISYVHTFPPQEFPCPICETPVKKVTLSTRTLDDVQCEKDTSWRRRVMKVFNKIEKDFATLREYNDYLEEVEDISAFT